MPKTGRLRLILVDVNNKVIRDRVAIRLQHRVLARIMREGAVEGKTQEPPCGTNVVQTTF